MKSSTKKSSKVSTESVAFQFEQINLLEKHLTEGLSGKEFRLLSENLVGFELNSLANWLRSHRYKASEAITLIHKGEIVCDYAATISLKG